MHCILPCVTHAHGLCALYTRLLHPWHAIIAPVYNSHPYFSLKNLAKSTRDTKQNEVICIKCLEW